ncbi:unnamed protein product [Rotaria socialis]|uniref:Uncharacterized protein n=1 Tax=Rotaria socialis TaxID=392032 RepID=A0A817NM65_9BILA|nr:unnamed protein product [Rotaria socialis]CAF3319230.1 unnamed protein product [Rotaria socialis]CAF3373952.1 unnamed protein product [Rotaria socialis]CAF3659623.1 unnamed protein product [Rotaria socialis]CAF4117871.1 unnamed protein product [Rotaria socialis]
MARTNLSVLPDVSVCLRDALDHMCSNRNPDNTNESNHTVMVPEENDITVDVVNDDDSNDTMLANDLQSITKRKTVNTDIFDQEQLNQNECVKRLRTTFSH